MNNKKIKIKKKYPAQKRLVEWLKVKALSSSPSTAKKKKEKERELKKLNTMCKPYLDSVLNELGTLF
jgi:hypothetical protein